MHLKIGLDKACHFTINNETVKNDQDTLRIIPVIWKFVTVHVVLVLVEDNPLFPQIIQGRL